MGFNPEMKVVRFGCEDVIATSGADRFVLSNIGQPYGDGTATYHGVTYGQGNPQSLQDFLGVIGNVGIRAGTKNWHLASVINVESGASGGQVTDEYNGTFVYDASANRYIKQ